MNKASFAKSATVGSGSTVRTIATNLHSAYSSLPAGWAAQGMVTFTSGVLSGKTYGIKSDDGAGNLSFTAPLPVAPASGDTCTVYAGCDRQQSTCLNKFSNLQNFAGFPYVPVPETAA